MPSNTAAWLVAEKTKPFEVKPAPYTSPREHEIVVKNAAVAINPVDWQFQERALWPANYPTIIGEDVAGVVVEVGSSVSRFRVGDRVLGFGLGQITKRDCEGAFQEHTVLWDNMSSPFPDTISFEAAAVIPCGLATAANGLYQKDYLGLRYPTTNPNATGQVLIVWGGASSVGSNGIQLAVSSGYEVITTASPKNFDYVKKIGASRVFDYNSKTLVDELVNALKGKTIAGVLDCITIDGVVEVCAEVLRRSEGGKFIATAQPASEDMTGGVKTKFMYCSDIKDNEVGEAVYEHYLPKALVEGKFVPAPDPVVVGHGLDAIQVGLEAQKKGVSAQKVVVTL